MIDFYAGKAPPGSSMPVAMHLDVRPALDSHDVSQAFTHQLLYSRPLVRTSSLVSSAFEGVPSRRVHVGHRKRCPRTAQYGGDDVPRRGGRLFPRISSSMQGEETPSSIRVSRQPQSERVNSSIDRTVIVMHAYAFYELHPRTARALMCMPPRVFPLARQTTLPRYTFFSVWQETVTVLPSYSLFFV